MDEARGHTVQWYPGHMTKSVRMMNESLKLVDVVIELLDSRIPYSSKNPEIDKLAKNKKRIILLNKSDLSDETATKKWAEYYKNQGFEVIAIDSIRGKNIGKITGTAMGLMKETIERDKARGRIFRPVRAMVAGIPNVGKSAFINKYVGKAAAKTGDKPGVTRGKQWIRLKKDFELLDTPGILWPKFEDRITGMNLAFTGAINDNILDSQIMGIEFINMMRMRFADILAERYGIEISEGEADHEVFDKICFARGFKAKGGEPDYGRCGKALLEDFRSGKFGKLTIEMPEDIPAREEAAEAEKQRKAEKKPKKSSPRA